MENTGRRCLAPPFGRPHLEDYKDDVNGEGKDEEKTYHGHKANVGEGHCLSNEDVTKGQLDYWKDVPKEIVYLIRPTI